MAQIADEYRIKSTAMALSPSKHSSLVPYVLMVAALSVTRAPLAMPTSRYGQDRLRFRTATTRVTTEIDTRLDAYIAMLHGGSGLFAASKRVEFDEFRAYANRLEMSRRYPGVQGSAFLLRAAGDRAHIQSVIATHARRSSSGRWRRPTAHTPSSSWARSDRNLHAMGFNMFSSRAAARRVDPCA
jgi:CHASE1-domain containing sensor protein